MTNTDILEFIKSKRKIIDNSAVTIEEIDELLSKARDLKQDFKVEELSKVKKEYISEFFKNISALHDSKKIYLKRNLGVKNDNALDGLAGVFYKSKGMRVATINERYIWNLCAKIYCFMGEVSNTPFELQLADKLESTSGRQRFETLLNNDLSKFEYLSRDLISFVRMLKSSNKYFDCEKLLFDLLSWNANSKYVQLKWANTFYANNKI